MPALSLVRCDFGMRAVGVRVAITCVVAATLGGCGNDDPIPIRDVRERSKTAAPTPTGLSAEERFGAAPAAPAANAKWRYDAPPTWTEAKSAAPGRIATFRVGARDDVEVSLSEAGGGLEANVNRWRGQMGADPLGADDLAKLPRKPFLGGEATYVDVSGKFAGGMGKAAIDDARLLGLARVLPAAAIFAKLVGPKAVVDGEVERFLAFAASVRAPHMASEPPPPAMGDSVKPPPAPAMETAPPAPSPTPAAGRKATAGRYRFLVPAGWSVGAERPMRIATFLVPASNGVEIAMSEFPGSAGGLAANVNRWRGQLGLDDLSDADVGKLPKIAMLGGDGVLVEGVGHFRDSMRGVDIENAMLFGAIAERSEASVFLKMTGPADAVRAQRKTFEELARSLERAP